MWIPWEVSVSGGLWQSPGVAKTPRINTIIISMLSWLLGCSSFTGVVRGQVSIKKINFHLPKTLTHNITCFVLSYCMPGCRCFRLDLADGPSIATFWLQRCRWKYCKVQSCTCPSHKYAFGQYLFLFLPSDHIFVRRVWKRVRDNLF